jgi:hypothetical protein
MAALMPHGPQGFYSLFVRNTASRPILIRNVRVWPRTHRVAKDESSKALIEGHAGFPAIIRFLEPSESAPFPFLPKREYRGLFAIVISWRRGSSNWLPQIPKVIFSSARTLDRLANR